MGEVPRAASPGEPIVFFSTFSEFKENMKACSNAGPAAICQPPVMIILHSVAVVSGQELLSGWSQGHVKFWSVGASCRFSLIKLTALTATAIISARNDTSLPPSLKATRRENNQLVDILVFNPRSVHVQRVYSILLAPLKGKLIQCRLRNSH